jgi:hypothetical protein
VPPPPAPAEPEGIAAPDDIEGGALIVEPDTLVVVLLPPVFDDSDAMKPEYKPVAFCIITHIIGHPQR